MEKLCPNCQKPLTTVSDTEFFCSEENLTFVVKADKNKPTPKGKIQVIEEELAITKNEVEKIRKLLFANDDLDII